MNWLEAILLGALQGVAEFLPISSSGHLALVEILLGIANDRAAHRFNIAVHFGTLLAVLVTYREDLRAILARGRSSGPEQSLAIAVVVGTMPLAFAVLPQVDTLVLAMEGSTRALGVAFLLTAAALSVSHILEQRGHAMQTRSGPSEHVATPPASQALPQAVPESVPPDAQRQWPPSFSRALAIGFAQLIAVTPGVSRSGSTMAAGLIAGLSREDTARFSFLLAIPAIAAATLKESVGALRESSPWSPQDVGNIAIGALVSFVVGLLSLRLLIELVRRFGLLLFVPYLVLLSMVCIVLL